MEGESDSESESEAWDAAVWKESSSVMEYQSALLGKGDSGAPATT